MMNFIDIPIGHIFTSTLNSSCIYYVCYNGAVCILGEPRGCFFPTEYFDLDGYYKDLGKLIFKI